MKHPVTAKILADYTFMSNLNFCSIIKFSKIILNLGSTFYEITKITNEP